MKKILIPIFLFFAAVSLFTEGCYYDNEAELHPEKYTEQASNCDTTIAMSYATHIKPILNSSCGTSNSCHSSSNTSGVQLNTYEGVKSQLTTDPCEATKLLSSISWDGCASFMPKNSTAKLNDCYITRIRLWIESGAPNN